MSDKRRRNPFIPWLIGVVIIIVADIWLVYRMFATACPAPGFVEAIVVIVIPSVYLFLMYMTFKSQS